MKNIKEIKSEKLTYHLERIEKKYPGKPKLNLSQMLKCIVRSQSTCNRIRKANELHKLPKLSNSQEYYRKGTTYFTYEYDILDIAKFLAGED
ncbi:MAG: hypothetical protein WA945_08765 [Arcobacteraceae bacterium]